VLAPLRQRDFLLLWSGMTASLLGDGIYFVAIAWESYQLANAPTALALVGAAWTLPTVLFLLVGGAFSDRVERRRLLLYATLVEAFAIGLIGALTIAGLLQLWVLLLLVAVYGGAQAFFNPALDAIVPALVDPEDLRAASALEHSMRPLALQFAGPALGGVLIALGGTGVAFLVDAGTFLVAAGTLMAMRQKSTRTVVKRSLRTGLDEVAEGFRFVRANPWLWGTLCAAALALLAFYGPSQVLLPFLVKNELHAGGATFGTIRAIGGLGAMIAALAVGQSGLPGRFVSAMLIAWALQSLAVAGYALAAGAWEFALISLLSGAFGAVGNVVWGTLMKTLVPNELLGRVSSLDWLVSIGLIPLSFAITGPIAETIGARATLIIGGVVAAGTMLAFLAVPGLRAPERDAESGFAASPATSSSVG
jgi:DHA3 family tetracycline resistance protein-like MFS transporter